MRVFAVLMLAAALAGCGTAKKYNINLEHNPVKMPAAVKERCEPIPRTLAHGATMGNLTQAYTGLVGLYGECATRDGAKAEWINSQGQ